jgi:hypothetical protein
MVTCTECGGEIEDAKYIAARFEYRAGLAFFWACEHYPAKYAPVRLAGKHCIESYCEQHPQYYSEVIKLMSEYEPECSHARSVN